MHGFRLADLKVLLVDDNAHMRRVLATLLHSFGMNHIVEAPDGLLAWQKLIEDAPDIVLVDYVMSRCDGVEFTRRVRSSQKGRTAQTPILMVTGHADRGTIEKARDAAWYRYLYR